MATPPTGLPYHIQLAADITITSPTVVAGLYTSYAEPHTSYKNNRWKSLPRETPSYAFAELEGLFRTPHTTPKISQSQAQSQITSVLVLGLCCLVSDCCSDNSLYLIQRS